MSGNQNSNSGTYNQKPSNNQNSQSIMPFKSSNFNHFNLLSLPKVKSNSIKNKINNKSENELDKAKKDFASLDEDLSRNKETLKIDFSSKNILVKVNPTSPNIKDAKENKINLKLYFSVTFVDKATQTEEIFFKKKWTYFVGLYRIMFPKLEKSGFSMQLKPIKFNSFKNSLSYINKRDYFLKSSILPPPQSNEVRNVNKNPSKIMNLIRQSKIHMDCLDDLKGLNSNNKNSNKDIKSGIMLPFGPIVPLHNNFSMDKHLNNENSDSENNIFNKNRNFSFGVRNPNLKFVSNPMIKSQNIMLGKFDDKKEYIFY
jgi:hypothetical protein